MQKSDGDVVRMYNSLNKRLEKFGLVISTWGIIELSPSLAIAKIKNPHGGYIINNISDIKVIEGFVDGLEYGSLI